MAMNFENALSLVKSGRRVAREGWNGKGMYIYLEESIGSRYEPCIVLFTAQGKYQPGWVPAQPDLFADDWCEVTS